MKESLKIRNQEHLVASAITYAPFHQTSLFLLSKGENKQKALKRINRKDLQRIQISQCHKQILLRILFVLLIGSNIKLFYLLLWHDNCEVVINGHLMHDKTAVIVFVNQLLSKAPNDLTSGIRCIHLYILGFQCNKTWKRTW